MKPINFRHRVRETVREHVVLPLEQEATARVVSVALGCLLFLIMIVLATVRDISRMPAAL
jgi:hypothetical protein